MGGDFYGCTVDRNTLANAGNMGFKAWSGKIPHTKEQLSL